MLGIKDILRISVFCQNCRYPKISQLPETGHFSLDIGDIKTVKPNFICSFKIKPVKIFIKENPFVYLPILTGKARVGPE